jgi:hypothetical protein
MQHHRKSWTWSKKDWRDYGRKKNWYRLTCFCRSRWATSPYFFFTGRPEPACEYFNWWYCTSTWLRLSSRFRLSLVWIASFHILYIAPFENWETLKTSHFWGNRIN